MSQGFQIVGALLVPAAFTLAQFRLLDPRSYAYLVLKLVGYAILAVLALRKHQWRFLLLEGVWELVSLSGLGIRLRGEQPAAH